MSDLNFTPKKTPYDFGLATFLPFNLSNKFGWRVILWTVLLSTIIWTAATVAIWPMMKGAFGEFQTLMADSESPEAVFGLLGLYMRFIGVLFLFGIVSFLVLCAAEAAILANYFHGEDKGTFPLKFDNDMWRVVGAKLLTGLIIGIAIFAVYIVLIVVIIAFAGVASAGGGSEAGAVIGGLFAFIAIIALFCVFIWLAVRLSSVAAVSVRDKKFSFGEGFRVSKGRFWPMFASFLVLGIGAYILQNILTYGAMFGLMGTTDMMQVFAGMETASGPDEALAMLKDIFTPGVLITLFIVSVLYTFVTLIQRLCMAGPGAHVAKLDQGVIKTADNFS